MSCCFQTAGVIGLQFSYFLHLFVLFFLSFFFIFFNFFLWGWPLKYLDSRPQNTFASSYKSVFSSLLVEVTRYFRPFKSYTVSHLNPPSRKKNSCMPRMPMFIYVRSRTSHIRQFIMYWFIWTCKQSIKQQNRRYKLHVFDAIFTNSD